MQKFLVTMSARLVTEADSAEQAMARLDALVGDEMDRLLESVATSEDEVLTSGLGELSAEPYVEEVEIGYGQADERLDHRGLP